MWSESSPFVRFIAWFKSWKNSGLLVKAGIRSCRAFPETPTYCQCPGMAGVGGEMVPALPVTHLRPKYFWISAFCSLGGFGLIKFKFPIYNLWVIAAVPAFHVVAFLSRKNVPRYC